MMHKLAVVMVMGVLSSAGCDKKSAPPAVHMPEASAAISTQPVPTMPANLHRIPPVYLPETAWQESAIKELLKKSNDAEWFKKTDESAGIRRALAIWALTEIGHHGDLTEISPRGKEMTRLYEALLKETPDTPRWKILRVLAMEHMGEKYMTGEWRNNLYLDFGIKKNALVQLIGGGAEAVALQAMAARAMVDRGIEFPLAMWQPIDRELRLSQQPDGGWTDKKIGDDAISGLAASALHDAAVMTATRTALEAIPDKNAGMAIARIRERINNGHVTDIVSAYFMQRAMMARGGAPMSVDKLIALTEKSDNDAALAPWGDDPRVTRLAFGILAVAEARKPLAFVKLNYGGNWNARPQDVDNLTHWFSRDMETPIRWQVADFTSPLPDAPILVVTGSKAVEFSAEEMTAIRRFIDRGGMVLSSCDGGKGAFSTSITVQGNRMMHGKFAFRAVDKDDPLLTIGNKLNPIPQMEVLSNGERVIWVNMLQDSGAAWQRFGGPNKEAFILGFKAWKYATVGSPAELVFKPAGARPIVQLHSVAVARVIHAGNWNPEPMSWDRMTEAAAWRGVAIQLRNVPVRELDPLVTPLAHVSLAEFEFFNGAELASFQNYIGKGGVLLIDAVAGKQGAALQVDLLTKAILPNANLQPRQVIGEDMLRTYAQRQGATLDTALREIRINGQLLMVVTQLDLSAGMAGIGAYGINGFSTNGARSVVMRVLTDVAK